MNYISRIKSRINNEGVYNTLKYVGYVGIDRVSKTLRNASLDLAYSGRLLNGNIKTSYKQFGANDIYHTDYRVMPLIFSHIEISPEDVLVDVGCGKGRIINYWLSKNCNNRIIGLELDPVIAKQTSSQFYWNKNIRIIHGDAVDNLPPDGTIYYFYNPFSREKVTQFENKLAYLSGNKPIKVIYYNPKSIDVFDNSRWNISYINFEIDHGIKRWGRLNKFHDLAIITRMH